MEEIKTILDRSAIDARLDELEIELSQQENQVEPPLMHYFTPGLYTREIYMAAGTLIISKIHKTEHPFVISAGKAYVKKNDGDWELLEAPYTGITYPGTRRVLYIEEDCVWTTFHPTDIVPKDFTEEGILKAVEAVEEVIIEKNPYVADMKKELKQSKNISV
jgi:hypothetical protein